MTSMGRVLRGTRNFISCNGIRTIIEYFTTQNEVETELEGLKTVYGIEIVQSIIKDDVISFDDYEKIDGLTDSIESLNYVLGKLIAGLVQPACLLDIIDELIIENTAY